ncbi:WD40 repeat-like protein [Rickenella mellea]|uniref:WD40 repeat-like protein n=1 Tax=Rickenella mellea TaxID=50990 RepID=A0A4Y7PE89_9AGAM|nr:WD40 repeat-like protein [Rickenella mellea]
MPLTYTLKRHLADKYVESATSIEFSLDGLLLATGSPSGRISIWAVEEGQVIDSFVGRSAVTSLQWVQGFLKQKESLGTILVGWHSGELAIIHVFLIDGYLAHYGPVDVLAFKNDPFTLATANRNGRIDTWLISEASGLGRLRTMVRLEPTAANARKPHRVSSLHWLDESERLVATLVYHGIVVYDTSTTEIIQVIHVPTMIGSGSLSPDKHTMVIHNLVNGFDSYELGTGKLVNEYHHKSCEYGEGNPVIPYPSLHVHQGRAILGGTPSGLTCLWDTSDGNLITTLDNSAGTVQAMAAFYMESKDLFLIATASSSPLSQGVPMVAQIWQTIDEIDDSQTYRLRQLSNAEFSYGAPIREELRPPAPFRLRPLMLFSLFSLVLAICIFFTLASPP